MNSQFYACPEPSAVAADDALNIATDPFMAAILADPVSMGDLAYEYLTRGMQGEFTAHFSDCDWLSNSWFSGDASWGMGTPPLDYAPEQSTPDLTTSPLWSFPSHFPSTPSPPPSQTPTPEPRQTSLPPHDPSCHRAHPFFESVRGKWCCDACGKGFRGHWECKRHILNAGNRVICLACNKKINGRDDSRRRHYYKHCKRMDLGRDSGSLSLEDAFVHV